MGKRVFYIPLAGLLALSISAFLVFSSVLHNWLNDYSTRALEADLNGMIQSLKQQNPPTQRESLTLFLQQQRLAYPTRHFSLFSRHGDLVASSRLNSVGSMTNSKADNPPEINSATAGNIGSNQRINPTDNQQTLFVAKPIAFEGFQGALRISTPTEVIKRIARDLETMVAGLLFTIVGGMALLARSLIYRLDRHLHSEQEQLEQHVENRTREVELLQRLANMLAACNSLSEAQQVVQDIVPRILGDINGAVSLMRSSRNQLEVKLDWGGDWPGANTFAPDECWALRKGKFHLANDKYTTLPCSHMRNVGEEQTLCIPLIAHGNTIGMMHLYMHNQNFCEERMQLAFTICEQLGLALANLTLQEKLRDQAVRDPLTGLHNRRFLEESIDHELMRAQRNQQNLSILMLDMDHFKRFNDNFGHDAGDYVLKALSSLLINGVRGEDIVCRVGGEELCIVMPDADGDRALQAAEKLCHQVRDLHLDFHGQSLGKLTLLIGISTFPEDAEDYQSLMKMADVAIYEAKENGRDHARHCNKQTMQKHQAVSPQVAETLRAISEKAQDSPQDGALDKDN
ncbi:MAG: diguanylate cyclase [Cellvibrionaceae bacterium]|nr:diguanylate cyclase [Cellvibrionaceae bacterium]|tara:strand:+ start:6386 stop:8098 length:1713 start_codon:yes stop_codon:yes gene_type:complete